MKTRFSTLGIAALLVAAGMSGCVPKPKQDYSIDQLKQVDSLEELMKVNASVADPQFNKIGQTSLTDAEYASMADAATRLQATSEAIRSKLSANRPPSFATFAARMNEQATELLAATQSKDAAKATTALTGIRDTCRNCHKEHR